MKSAPAGSSSVSQRLSCASISVPGSNTSFDFVSSTNTLQDSCEPSEGPCVAGGAGSIWSLRWVPASAYSLAAQKGLWADHCPTEVASGEVGAVRMVGAVSRGGRRRRGRAPHRRSSGGRGAHQT